MSKIQIIEKPDWITWDDIHKCLWNAHSSNRDKGIVMKTTLLSGKELKERVEKKSLSYKTFVALDGDKLVGTGTVSIQNKRAWFVYGKVAYIMLAGVLPEYAGLGIYKQISLYIEREGEKNGCELLYMDTAESNTKMRALQTKQGFKYVGYFASPSKHYSVVMAKWYIKQPFSDLYITLRYIYVKYRTRILFKRGGIKRF